MQTLLTAIRRRQPDVVRELINNGADVNERIRFDDTPLLFAISRVYQLEYVRQLIRERDRLRRNRMMNEASIDEISERIVIYSPPDFELDASCNAPILEIIKMLIEAGADVEARDSLGNTPLHVAVNGWLLPVVEMLLEAGADINERDPSGDVPLHVAIWHGDTEMALLLISRGANLDIRSNKQHHLSALLIAMHERNMGIVEALLDFRADINVYDHSHATEPRTPLMQAAASDNREMLHLLVSRGADETLTTPKTKKTALEFGAPATREYLSRLLRARTDMRLALMMGLHPRLGANSPLNNLEPDILRDMILRGEASGDYKLPRMS